MQDVMLSLYANFKKTKHYGRLLQNYQKGKAWHFPNWVISCLLMYFHCGRENSWCKYPVFILQICTVINCIHFFFFFTIKYQKKQYIVGHLMFKVWVIIVKIICVDSRQVDHFCAHYFSHYFLQTQTLFDVYIEKH